MYVKRAFNHRSREKIRNYIADKCGVSVEHLLETIRKRKAYRSARYQRNYKRKKKRRMNPLSDPSRSDPEKMFSGEGELHGYLRMFGMSLKEFSRQVGISYNCVRDWSAHPLYAWPVEYLRMYGWSQNMAAKLREMGVDPEQFKPPLPDKRTKKGTYPRTKKDAVVITGDYSPFKPLPRVP